MYIVFGNIAVKPEGMDAVREVIGPYMEAVRNEEGNLSFAIGEDLLEPGRLCISGRWMSMEAIEAHRASQHAVVWREGLKKAGVLHREVVAFEAGQGVNLG